MKKIILVLILSAIMILSGCSSAPPEDSAPSGFYYSDMSSAEIIESLAKRMQNNIDTHTIEGFKGGSTFGEVLEKTEKDKIVYAELKYIDEILGYPAEMCCDFKYNGKDGLSLNRLDYFVLRSGEQAGHGSSADILNMLDAEFGSHKQDFNGFGFLTYTWEKNGSLVEFYEIGGESGWLASISLYAPSVVSGKLPEASDIFPYRLGEDLSVIYENETPDIIPDGFSPYSALRCWNAEGAITFLFRAVSGKLKLCGGGYDFDTKNMGNMDSTEHLESIKENMKSILGDPEKEYPVKSETELNMTWPGIFMRAECKEGAGIYVAFFEEYFEGTANE